MILKYTCSRKPNDVAQTMRQTINFFNSNDYDANTDWREVFSSVLDDIKWQNPWYRIVISIMWRQDRCKKRKKIVLAAVAA